MSTANPIDALFATARAEFAAPTPGEHLAGGSPSSPAANAQQFLALPRCILCPYRLSAKPGVVCRRCAQ